MGLSGSPFDERGEKCRATRRLAGANGHPPTLRRAWSQTSNPLLSPGTHYPGLQRLRRGY
jgi:hypothetical protein